MTTFVPRAPYTQDELDKLYPKGLQLQLVQVILRHGERSPVKARFQNAGLPDYWPYCSAARHLRSAIMEDGEGRSWSALEWRRRLETFGRDDGPAMTSGPGGEVDGICNNGELTDQGRATTLALGQRLRHLYVDQLAFMPKHLADADLMYLRATPIPRALESVQQAFAGMYPRTARTMAFPPPTIVTRANADETLFPNDSNCRRFSQLSRAFAQRTADRWNGSAEMDYLTKLIGRWMPEGSPRVAVDSHPRLSGIMDTVNATLAHPAPTRLPKEFYDAKAREILDRVNVEEWYGGYKESREYRTVGIGGLAGDVVERMVGSAEHDGRADGLAEMGDQGVGRGGETAIRFGLSGAHDTTLAAVLTALGAFEGEKWPPFTSHVAFELFRHAPPSPSQGATAAETATHPGARPPVGSLTPAQIALGQTRPAPEGRGLWDRLLGSKGKKESPIARRPLVTLVDVERARLDGYYVRIRYNDRVMKVPGCTPQGQHLEGDDSFCTLEAFKRIVDKFTPPSWHDACVANLDKPAFPEKLEPAGW